MTRKNLSMALFILIIIMNNNIVNAQNENSYSIFTGGMVLKNSLLSTTKSGYEFGNFALISDFTFDQYKEKWSDGSSGKFLLTGFSSSVRYYLNDDRMGFFGEAGFGMSKVSLTTKAGGTEKKVSENIPMASIVIGYRYKINIPGLFLEGGYRTSTPLKSSHLYTTENKPETESGKNIGYQSWNFEKFRFSGQIYLGLGYSF